MNFESESENTAHSSAEDGSVEMGIDMLLEEVLRDTDSAGDESELELQHPRRKRTRDTINATRTPNRKKQARGKQGRLAGLMNMPIDIFTEIMSHLLPVDIISMSRSNKYFRNMLMNRSSLHIWRVSMRNVPGLPDCPPDMSEPSYLALVFLKRCTKCGNIARGKLEGELRVRLCTACRHKHLIPIDEVPAEIRAFPPRSYHIFIPEHKLSINRYMLAEDVSSLEAEFNEVQRLDDLLETWIDEKTEKVLQRQREHKALTEFFDNLDNDREKELTELKDARRSDIQHRLKALGWQNEDIPPNSKSEHYRTWNALVNQPKPLTDRIWINLRPKLITLLKNYREHRLELERRQRKLRRQGLLMELLAEIKGNPSLTFQVRESGLFPNSRQLHSRTFNHNVFPNLAHAFALPLLKDLYDTDTTTEEMEDEFEDLREDIEALIDEWKNEVLAHFTNQAATHGISLCPTLISYDGNPEPFVTIPDNIKSLLRADSLFRITRHSETQNTPRAYTSIIYSESLTWMSQNTHALITPKALNLEHVSWYPEAHEIAKALLASVGKPDVSYMEIKGYPLTRIYMCGRCQDTTPRSWEELIKHYIEQNQKHSAVQNDLESSDGETIVYNDIHDRALDTDLPLIKYYEDRVQTKIMDVRDQGLGRLQVCKVCDRIPGVDETVGSQSFVVRHLLDVHGIAKPKFDEHYAPKL
ncbi:ATP-dependent helicase/deoxyribonuclease subunit B [Rhizoctonia solani]|uniref:ATP-dependent helicase/deoxyribonuclease subunit B n=1 Tax=Rhizoctonia solani TaxID=456999 RepID=A0A0K6GHR9_9AGAM|nr:ATP-dependent helicase/deoxyribonuclease subunit B [Rhizoctonia solani]